MVKFSTLEHQAQPGVEAAGQTDALREAPQSEEDEEGNHQSEELHGLAGTKPRKAQEQELL